MEKTVRIVVKGKVQGVFFRANVRRRAMELGLVGYAKNLGNGDVEVVACGNPAAISALEEFILSNPGNARVGEIARIRADLGRFVSFDVC